MKFCVHLRNNYTKETRIIPQSVTNADWDDSQNYMWSEGNYSCDCNRGLFFNNWEREDDVCGEGKYSIIMIVLEDGTEIPMDNDI